MAIQTATVTLTSASSGTFTFDKPAGNYGKTQPGLTITDGGEGVVSWYTADVDNGDGTMTGTVNLSDAITGTAELIIYDRV